MFHTEIYRTLALCSLTFISAFQAQAWNSPNAAHVIEGIATTENGQPLANASLFLLGLQPSQGPTARPIAEITVTTDVKGHFTWNVPADVNLVAEKHGNLPEFSALPIDSKAWKFSFAIKHYQIGNNDNDVQRDLLRDATRQCTEHWLRTGPTPLLSVVAPDTGYVTTQIRDSNGYPVNQSPVKIVIKSPRFSSDKDIIYTGRTDSDGYLGLRCYPGMLRFQVVVPGIGFGSTGTFPLLARNDVEPQTPPLAAFARITGSVARILHRPGSIVHLDDYGPNESLWHQATTTINAQGEFTLSDVIAGEHRVVLTNSTEYSQAAEITAMPGDAISGIILQPNPMSKLSSGQTGEAEWKRRFSVRGRVLDAAGHPVADTEIYAIWYPAYGSSITPEALSAKSASDGSYQISGLPVGSSHSRMALVASHADYPLTEVFSARSQNGDIQRDLILAFTHSELTIHVLQDGKPCAGAKVRLTLQDGTGLGGDFSNSSRSEQKTLAEVAAAALSPITTTDTNGTAHFQDLMPGRWNIIATTKNGPELSNLFGWWGGSSMLISPNNVSSTVVQSGQTRNVTINLHEQSNEATVHVFTPTGLRPHIAQMIQLYGPATSTSETGLGDTLDHDGNTTYHFVSPGLYRLTTRFREIPSNSIPMNSEPYFGNSVLVAVSPALPRTTSIAMHTKIYGPGKIRVHLQDADGHLQPGAVIVSRQDNGAQYAASFDKNGEAVFPDMPSGSYRLQATFVQSSKLPSIGAPGSPFPSDAALRGVKLLIAQQTNLKSDQESIVTFQPTSIGYIRGKLALAAADSPKNYGIYADSPYSLDLPCKYRYEPATGEFLAGPFLPGQVILHVQRLTHENNDEWANGNNFPVTVTAGQVIHISPVPFVDKSQISSGTRLVQGQVLLSDGKTPAWGAHVALVNPTSVGMIQIARADALGHLNADDHWFSSFTKTQSPPGSPTEPVLVAWLPGANGAVIAPYIPGQEAHLTLPAPITVRGHVTIGGKPVLGQPSSFQIRAAYQGHGNLNELLSIDATSEADGSFELAGLTPGTYQVQAARDGIWLSQTQMLVAGVSAPSALTLDIAPIGTPVALHILDKLGKPLVNQDVDVIRPDGPLTEALWPKSLTTDGVGILRLEGLEAGPHAVQIGATRFNFEVPEWKEGNADIEQTISTSLESHAHGEYLASN